MKLSLRKVSLRKGFGFGLTSGIITTLGLIVGLNSSTGSSIAVIGGILVIAIADAMSDALGIHISEESENRHTENEIWESTASTFLSKLIFSLSFAVPVLLLPLHAAVMVSVVWGLSLIGIFSYTMARRKGMKPYNAIVEHLAIAAIVIVVSHYVGEWVAAFFV